MRQTVELLSHWENPERLLRLLVSMPSQRGGGGERSGWTGSKESNVFFYQGSDAEAS